MLKYDNFLLFLGGGIEKQRCDDSEVMGYTFGFLTPFFVRLFVASVILSFFSPIST